MAEAKKDADRLQGELDKAYGDHARKAGMYAATEANLHAAATELVEKMRISEIAEGEYMKELTNMRADRDHWKELAQNLDTILASANKSSLLVRADRDYLARRVETLRGNVKNLGNIGTSNMDAFKPGGDAYANIGRFAGTYLMQDDEAALSPAPEQEAKPVEEGK